MDRNFVSRSALAAVATAVGVGCLALALPAAAQTGAGPHVKVFSGSDGNWFNPNNWNEGRLPGPADTVVLDANDYVLIDPSQGPMPVEFGDLHMSGNAVLETRPGSVVRNQDSLIIESARTIFRGSVILGESETFRIEADSANAPTAIYNPITKDKRDIVINTKMTIEMGLGGREPASYSIDPTGAPIVNTGYGHYVTLNADRVELGGAVLSLSLYYGFEPEPGDRFQIVNARRSLAGQFDGLPEGELLGCTSKDVGLRISYRGGDGNDVVLTAERGDVIACLTRKRIDKSSPLLTATATAVTQTREHILLATETAEEVVAQTREHVLLGTSPSSGGSAQTREHIFLSN